MRDILRMALLSTHSSLLTPHNLRFLPPFNVQRSSLMRHYHLIIFLLLIVSAPLYAVPADTLQSVTFVDNVVSSVTEELAEVKRKVEKLDAYDENYIEPNHYNYTFMLQNTNYWQHYRLRATDTSGRHQQIDISPRSSIKVGPYFGWRWLFLGYTFDVGSMGKATKNTEFTLSLYSAKIGGDLMYIRNKDNFQLGGVKGFSGVRPNALRGTDFNGMKSYTTMAHIYYVFNNRRFSYPAAYAQSTVQRVSAGSLILGLRYDHHKIHFDHRQLPSSLQYAPDGTPLLFDAMKIGRVNYYNLGLSVGYAYNWVFAPNCLFNISLSPSLGYKKTKGQPWDESVLISDVKTLNFDFTSRAALVWNNSRLYAGASFVNYIYGYNRALFRFRNSICYLNFYVGFNFHRREKRGE